MNRILLAILIAFTGCKKTAVQEKTPDAQAAEIQQTAQEIAQVEAQFVPSPASTAKPDAPLQERLNGAIHPELTAQLRIFKSIKGRLPNNIPELINTARDSAPPMPRGMHLEIDKVEETVKVIRN